MSFCYITAFAHTLVGLVYYLLKRQGTVEFLSIFFKFIQGNNKIRYVSILRLSSSRWWSRLTFSSAPWEAWCHSAFWNMTKLLVRINRIKSKIDRFLVPMTVGFTAQFCFLNRLHNVHIYVCIHMHVHTHACTDRYTLTYHTDTHTHIPCTTHTHITHTYTPGLQKYACLRQVEKLQGESRAKPTCLLDASQFCLLWWWILWIFKTLRLSKKKTELCHLWCKVVAQKRG